MSGFFRAIGVYFSGDRRRRLEIVLRRTNRVLDAFIIFLIFVLFVLAGSERGQERRNYLTPDNAIVIPSYPQSAWSRTEPLSPERCAEMSAMINYYNACTSDHPQGSKAPLTCPEDMPEGIYQPPANRQIATFSAMFYRNQIQQGHCDTPASADLNEPKERQTDDPN